MPGVAVYDLSGKAGYAILEPGRDEPRHGIVRLPPPSTTKSNGAAFKLLFEHIAWADRICGGLDHLGYEAPLIATGGNKDDDKGFISNPHTTKRLVGLTAVMELCATMLGIPVHSINNASWRKFWLPGTPRGTERKVWKAKAIDKATRLGWLPKGDDDADALGQLHYLLDKLAREDRANAKLYQVPWQSSIDRTFFSMGLSRR